jgi:hypothetical protein
MIMAQILWFFWDMIDISENMHRSDRMISRQRNGVPAAWHAAAYAVVSVALLAAVWYFDIQSTLVGLSSVTDVIIPTLPTQVIKFTWFVIVAFTVLPTLLELFSGALAKEDIKIVQLSVIGFTLFDAVTDIPRAYGFAMQLWPQIQLLGWGIDILVFYTFFLVIIFFATIGLEILLCLFLYLTGSFFWKIFHGEGAYVPRRRSSSNSVHVNDSDDRKVPIIIEG